MLLRRCCPGDVFPKLVSWTEFGCRARLGQAARTDTAAMLGEWFNNLEPGWNRDFSRVEFNSRSRPHSPGRRQQLVPEVVCWKQIRLFVFGSRAV